MENVLREVVQFQGRKSTLTNRSLHTPRPGELASQHEEAPAAPAGRCGVVVGGLREDAMRAKKDFARTKKKQTRQPKHRHTDELRTHTQRQRESHLDLQRHRNDHRRKAAAPR